MKNGKYSRFSRHFHTRYILVLVSLTLIIAIAAGATVAYLIDSTNEKKNEFQPSQVTSQVVEETWNGAKKENAKIQNTGDVSAFIRAEIVVTWKAANGDVLHVEPIEDTDYTMTLATDAEGSDWFIKNGYYYFKNEVAANGLTDALIISAEANATKEDTNGNEYFVSIEIISSAIQSQGVKADGITHPVEDAWKVTYNAGTPATIS